jgi:hypothetical protein
MDGVVRAGFKRTQIAVVDADKPGARPGGNFSSRSE